MRFEEWWAKAGLNEKHLSAAIAGWDAAVADRQERIRTLEGEAHAWKAVWREMVARIERVKGLLHGLDPFQGGRDGDQCIWCHRDRDRGIDSWEKSQHADFHDADCEFVLAVAALDGEPKERND
jgi:hypothetical protein